MTDSYCDMSVLKPQYSQGAWRERSLLFLAIWVGGLVVGRGPLCIYNALDKSILFQNLPFNDMFAFTACH